jgi:hypothetical protein
MLAAQEYNHSTAEVLVDNASSSQVVTITDEPLINGQSHEQVTIDNSQESTPTTTGEGHSLSASSMSDTKILILKLKQTSPNSSTTDGTSGSPSGNPFEDEPMTPRLKSLTRSPRRHHSNGSGLVSRIRGPWTLCEDTKLTELVQSNGACRWSTIASMLDTGRIGKQCRERYSYSTVRLFPSPFVFLSLRVDGTIIWIQQLEKEHSQLKKTT